MKSVGENALWRLNVPAAFTVLLAFLLSWISGSQPTSVPPQIGQTQPNSSDVDSPELLPTLKRIVSYPTSVWENPDVVWI